jgi:hypothetical protein
LVPARAPMNFLRVPSRYAEGGFEAAVPASLLPRNMSDRASSSVG